MRSFLTGLGIAIGITAVILLTSIGEGLHQFVLSEFSQFGTNIISIQPGKTQTQGGNVGIFGSVRTISIEDAQALSRLPNVEYADPSVTGNAELRFNGKTRRTTVYGAGHNMDKVMASTIQSGSSCRMTILRSRAHWPCLARRCGRNCTRGRIRWAAYLRIGGQRYRVIGVMAPKGQILGFDLDEPYSSPLHARWNYLIARG